MFILRISQVNCQDQENEFFGQDQDQLGPTKLKSRTGPKTYLSCSFCSLDLFLFEVVELLNCAVGLDKNDVMSVSFCNRISSSSDGISFANFGKYR